MMPKDEDDLSKKEQVQHITIHGTAYMIVLNMIDGSVGSIQNKKISDALS